MTLLEYINQSFLKPLLKEQNITDISYNGEAIFYQDTFKGRCKSNIRLCRQDALDFLRQISNFTNTQFNLKNPILDISFDNFRLNATFYSISNKNKKETVTFSLRILSKQIRIKNDNTFYPEKLLSFFLMMIHLKSSILIAGLPSSGKSEFQKYLISLMDNKERLVVIDTINELDLEYSENVDITLLTATEMNNVSISDLLKLSLRYNPDYVIIAEARGSEFEQILTSSLSGISTITTIHSKNIDTIIDRAINMIQINNKNLSYDLLKTSILDHFDLLFYISKEENEKHEIVRSIKNVSLIYNREIYPIYENKKINRLPQEFINQNISLIHKFNLCEEFYV